MNEKVWHDIFKKWIDSNNSIETLYKNDVITEWDEINKMRSKLLLEIIDTVKSEVEE